MLLLFRRPYGLNQGGASSQTPPAPDTTPGAFSFTDVTGAYLSTTYSSDVLTISGINAPTPISIVGGEWWSSATHVWTSAPGFIGPGDSFAVRGTSSGFYSDGTDIVVTIGGVPDTFTITTMSDPDTITLEALVLDLDTDDDTGSSSTDNLTNTSSGTLNVSAAEALAGDTFRLYKSGVEIASDVWNGTDPIVFSGVSFSAGDNDYTATYERPGALSTMSATLTVTYDGTSPTITTASTASVDAGDKLAISLTANETVTWSITGGAQAAFFEISGTTLRLLGDADASGSGDAVVQVTATDTAGNATNKTITVTVVSVGLSLLSKSSHSFSVVDGTGSAHAVTVPNNCSVFVVLVCSDDKITGVTLNGASPAATQNSVVLATGGFSRVVRWDVTTGGNLDLVPTTASAGGYVCASIIITSPATMTSFDDAFFNGSATPGTRTFDPLTIPAGGLGFVFYCGLFSQETPTAWSGATYDSSLSVDTGVAKIDAAVVTDPWGTVSVSATATYQLLTSIALGP